MSLVAYPLVEPHQDACVAANESMNVFFRFVDGKTFCLWLDPSLDIQAVKEKLLAHKRATGLSPTMAAFLKSDIFFVWNGKPLDEDMLLRDYNMSPNSTVFVGYRNKGGCFMVSCSILAVICTAIVDWSKDVCLSGRMAPGTESSAEGCVLCELKRMIEQSQDWNKQS